jgi:homoserine kinase
MADDDGSLRSCAVRVPCSTSNLGAGFDCLGLAFDRYLDVGYVPGPAGTLDIRRTGSVADLDVPAHEDLIITGFLAELQRHGIRDAGGEFLVHSEIPVGRGLGSSGAATVAGIALATAARSAVLDRAAALGHAVRSEGHPDNAAPSLFGGLTAVIHTEHGVPNAVRMPLSPEVGFVFAAPDAVVSTQRARTVLPQQVPHSAAVRNTSRMAALLYGLAHAERHAISAGFNDELHIPYRLPLIPGAREAMAAATAAGAWAVTISGSGSGLVAACAHGAEHPVLEAMCAAFARGGHGGDGFIASPDMHGAQPRDVVSLRASLAR